MLLNAPGKFQFQCKTDMQVLLCFLRPAAAAASQVMINLALKGLPRFRCLSEAYGHHRTTTHLLPDEHCLTKAPTCCCRHCCCSDAASQVNLALKGLPRFRCLPEAHGQHRTTTHLLLAGHAAQRAWQAFQSDSHARLTCSCCCATCCLLPAADSSATTGHPSTERPAAFQVPA
jgi:hypothetical protein